MALIVTLLSFLFLNIYNINGSYSSTRKSFTIDFTNNQFLKDGKPFRYISGGMHYFRVPSQYWADRLHKLRMGGMNAVQTYVAWNVHEEFKGQYKFSGDNDVVKFIKLAQANDLLVILRAGPYICAEWEYGGFPYWIMKEVTPSQLRTKSDVYLRAVDKWMSVLLSKMKPLLYSNGGPIISVQVEDAYGGYGKDHVYMRKLGGIFQKYLGDDVILFSNHPADDWFLRRGTIPSLFNTVDFGPGGDPQTHFSLQRKYQARGPLVNSEYYAGWFDHVGEKHSRVSGKVVANTLDGILALNASVNLYMFVGGTNFGFMNGANFRERLRPQPTSYDYDAPLTEAGDLTKKYVLIRKVVSKHHPLPPGPLPKRTEKAAYGVVKATKTVSLYNFLDHLKPVMHEKPLSFETLDVPYGYVLYRASIHNIFLGKAFLTMKKVHDRAVVLVDGQTQGIVYTYNSTITISEGSTLDILVENQGRVNYGNQMRDTAKGILDDVIVNGHVVTDWKMYAVNETVLLSNPYQHMNTKSNLEYQEAIVAPCLTYFYFDVGSKMDTFLKLDSWTKGVVLLNGFNLGRYWTPAGPQKTLYVPQHLLKDHNTVIVFESDALPTDRDERTVEFVNKPEWTD